MSNNYTGNVIFEILQKSVDIFRFILYTSLGRVTKVAGVYGILAQLGEHLPYKQRVIGSSPIGPISKYADVAQLAEQLICNQQVIGSSPIVGFVLVISARYRTILYAIYGWIPEWPKGTDCKSAANCFGGSNPPPSSYKAEKSAYNI